MENALQWNDDRFMREVERRSQALVSACFQCHKCSSGCPMSPDMDLVPSQVMRLIHLGAEEQVLGCRAIWLCASCEACSTRCPMGIDIRAVMDALRMVAVERGSAPPDARGKHFNHSFLNNIRRHGRVFELEMLLAYKLRTGRFFDDMDKAPEMLSKGKLSLTPKRSGNTRHVRKVFKRAMEEEKKR